MHAGHEVLMEINHTSALIGANHYEILGQQLRPHSICLLTTIIILDTYENITYY